MERIFKIGLFVGATCYLKFDDMTIARKAWADLQAFHIKLARDGGADSAEIAPVYLAEIQTKWVKGRIIRD